MAARKKHRGIFVFLILLVLGACFWYFENFTIATHTEKVVSDKLTSEVRLVQLTDLHGQTFGKENRSLIRRVESLHPDLIVVTGDMYTSGDEIGRKRAVELMAALPKPIYFVPGEHDHKKEFLEELRAVGVHVLAYEQEELTVGENRLLITGIDNAYFGPTFDLNNAFDPPPADSYNLLLSHLPSFSAFQSFGADLILSGDTHGGIVRLPFLGCLYYQGSWFPKFTLSGPVYDKGLFEQDGKHLFVSSGLGSYPLPVRLFNRPEVVLLRLLPKE